ncbi:hypothetical protein GGX14DRAFT_376292 [Mycena pura]|uniref:Uncharacterized protein n=1 Tax=Mycena pura TaxID=153505 RepID=A0AAD6V085_9AGAR|nr:hypothetical protein GGX14DRAFT_376292 [Mycena pura]
MTFSFILLLTLLLSHIKISTQEHTLLELRDLSDTCNDINSSRTLYSIIWKSLITIFACVWVSVHPNIPPPEDVLEPPSSWMTFFRRRVKFALIAVIAPELVVGFAARQCVVAWKFSQSEYSPFSHPPSSSFLTDMGGFVTKQGHYPITTEDRLTPENIAAMLKIQEVDIQDRSKGDALVKGLALVQVLRSIAEPAARVQQGLPVTELEVATVAFAFINVFIWCL